VARLLVVDDELNMRRILGAILNGDGHEVVEAAGVEEARRAFAASPFDLVVTDQRMPDGDGLSLLVSCREVDPTVPVVLITAYATVELAVDAMRQGAFDVVPKPFVPETVRAVVNRACERTELLRENERLRGQVRRLTGSGELVGDGPEMARLLGLIARVAPTGATVLISGETGTGKELVARAIHAASGRAGKPFVAVNCAGFPETLLESELFGHERGAFTGADRSRQGVFEAAHLGTLFLDEAGEMPLPLQAKLLRVLMNGEVVRVGSTVPRHVDVRIIAATNRDLEQRVRDGLFREDLYYRLAVVPIAVPPLRSRRSDIRRLVDHFLALVARDLKAAPRAVSPDAMAKLLAYDFPGNIRELRNLIERAAILAVGPRIEAEDVPLAAAEGGAGAGGPRWGKGGVEALVAGLPDPLDLPATMAAVEEALIRRAIGAAGGVQAEAARRLGVSRSHLAYKLKTKAKGDKPTP
jgi:DNA-binding NtrC family response regulator